MGFFRLDVGKNKMNKKRSLLHRILLKASTWIGRRQSRSYKRLRDKAIAFDLLMGMPEVDLARIYHVSIDTVRHAKRRAPKSIYITIAAQGLPVAPAGTPTPSIPGTLKNVILNDNAILGYPKYDKAGSPSQEGDPQKNP